MQGQDFLTPVENPRNYYTIDAKRLTSRHKTSQQDKQVLYGVKQFNLDPGKGLNYLQDKLLVQETPESIAQFLFEQDRLSKKAIGLCSKYLALVNILFCSRFVSWREGPAATSCAHQVCLSPPVHRLVAGPSTQAVPVELQTAWRGPADRQGYVVFCRALLPAEYRDVQEQ